MMTETVVHVEYPANNNAANKTQQPEEQRPLGGVKINLEYFKTLPGLLKIVELVFGILSMALASPAYLSATHFFLFVVVTSFIGTLIWVFVYFLGIREATNIPIHWILTELLNTGIVTVCYFIAFIVQLASWSQYSVFFGSIKEVNIAGGVFALFNTPVYGFATYLLYLEYKRGNTE